MSRRTATIKLLEPQGFAPSRNAAWRWGLITALIRWYAADQHGGAFCAHDLVTDLGLRYRQASQAIRRLHRRGELRLVRSHQPGRYGCPATFKAT